MYLSLSLSLSLNYLYLIISIHLSLSLYVSQRFILLIPLPASDLLLVIAIKY